MWQVICLMIVPGANNNLALNTPNAPLWTPSSGVGASPPRPYNSMYGGQLPLPGYHSYRPPSSPAICAFLSRMQGGSFSALERFSHLSSHWIWNQEGPCAPHVPEASKVISRTGDGGSHFMPSQTLATMPHLPGHPDLGESCHCISRLWGTEYLVGM